MVWGLGERICRDDFSRRWMLFRYLMQSVMSYGAEIWGCEGRKGFMKVMMDYIRWIFNLDFCTPRYLMSKELGIEKLKVRWGIKAIRFEERIKNLKEKSWVKRCWKEKEKEGWKDQYGLERKVYYNRNGWGIEAIENMGKEERKYLEKEIVRKEKDIQKQTEKVKIRKAKYNKRYKEINKEIGSIGI